MAGVLLQGSMSTGRGTRQGRWLEAEHRGLGLAGWLPWQRQPALLPGAGKQGRGVWPRGPGRMLGRGLSRQARAKVERASAATSDDPASHNAAARVCRCTLPSPSSSPCCRSKPVLRAAVTGSVRSRPSPVSGSAMAVRLDWSRASGQSALLAWTGWNCPRPASRHRSRLAGRRHKVAGFPGQAKDADRPQRDVLGSRPPARSSRAPASHQPGRGRRGHSVGPQHPTHPQHRHLPLEAPVAATAARPAQPRWLAPALPPVPESPRHIAVLCMGVWLASPLLLPAAEVDVSLCSPSR